ANQHGISGSYNPATGVLTLTGRASIADYQAALGGVTYRDISADPSAINRTVTFRVDDGAAANNYSNLQSRTVAVAAVNTAPALTVPGARVSGPRDTDIALAGISVADPDAHAAVERLTLLVTHGKIRFVNLAGITVAGGLNNSPTVTVIGSIANLNAALAGGNLV